MHYWRANSDVCKLWPQYATLYIDRRFFLTETWVGSASCFCFISLQFPREWVCNYITILTHVSGHVCMYSSVGNDVDLLISKRDKSTLCYFFCIVGNSYCWAPKFLSKTKIKFLGRNKKDHSMYYLVYKKHLGNLTSFDIHQ